MPWDSSGALGGAGTAYAAELDGESLSAEKAASVEEPEGGEELTIKDGENVFEEHDVAATEIRPP